MIYLNVLNNQKIENGESEQSDNIDEEKLNEQQ